MRISNRLAVALVMLVTTAIASGVVGWVAVETAGVRHRDRTKALLRSELLARSAAVQRYLDAIAQDLGIVAGSRLAQESLAAFEGAFEELGEDAASVLARLYITDNPNPAGRKQALLRANDYSSYSEYHARYHGWFSKLASARDYRDVFLVNATGNVLYTVSKQADFASDLLNGEYKETELADTFRALLEEKRQGQIVFKDFVRYAPSDGAPAAFVGTPLFLDGEFKGAFLVQLKSDRFNELMLYSRIMGASGETYLVGPDRLMRSRSRFEEESTVLGTTVDTASVEAAFDRTTGVHSVTDYRGVPVMSAYAPLTWQDVTWAVLAEIDEAEVRAPLWAMARRLAIVGLGCCVIAFAAGWLLAGNGRMRQSTNPSAPEPA